MRRLSIGFGVALLIMFVAAFIVSMDFHRLARYYPLVASGLGVLLSILFLIQESRAAVAASRSGRIPVSGNRAEQNLPKQDAEQARAIIEDEDELLSEGAGIAKTLPYLGWFVGYVALIRVFGIFVATAMFLGAFLGLQARMRWWGVLISMTVVIALLYAMGDVMSLHWPASLVGW